MAKNTGLGRGHATWKDTTKEQRSEKMSQVAKALWVKIRASGYKNKKEV